MSRSMEHRKGRVRELSVFKHSLLGWVVGEEEVVHGNWYLLCCGCRLYLYGNEISAKATMVSGAEVSIASMLKISLFI